MSFRDDLVFWGRETPGATGELYENNPIAHWIRSTLPASILGAAGTEGVGLSVKGSAGSGRWATVTWAALFEPTVTGSATRGYYVVYLLSPDGQFVHLSLNQGTTAITEEFGAKSRAVLRERAAFIRRRVADFGDLLADETIDLGGAPGLPSGYEAGHAIGRTYRTAALPDDSQLGADLHAAIKAYRALIFRGGLDLDADEKLDDIPGGATIDERRRYRMHRKIERNPKAATLAKKHHGLICQVCGFDFKATYGAVGDGYIEAHHLRPLSSLLEGAVVKYDVANDFAVLCANCHRMIHRLDDVADLTELRRRLARL